MGNFQRKIKRKVNARNEKESREQWSSTLLKKIYNNCIDSHQSQDKKDPLVEFPITLKDKIYFCQECFSKYRPKLENDLKKIPFCYFCGKMATKDYSFVDEENLSVRICKICLIMEEMIQI